MADVYLHIGLPKTGTTTIQTALDAAHAPLARAGVLVPGGGHDAHRLAAYDLVGQRVPGRGDAVAGAFGALVSELRAYDGRAAIVSEEELGRARPRHVRRVARELAGHRLHLVVGVRDLARTLTSAWQQAVISGATTTWAEHAAAVRDPGAGSVQAATSFRLRHDVLRALEVWGAVVPPERVHLVTVPPPGAPGSVLLERFAEATDLPLDCWDLTVPSLNRSLGVAELELVRRLNVDLAGRLPAGPYRLVVEGGLRRGWPVLGSRRLALPPEDLPWVRERSEALVAELGRRRYPVHGDLADLVPDPTPACRRLDEVDDAELLAAARAGLTALAVAHADLARRHRRLRGRRSGLTPTWGELLDSSARAAWFGVQRGVLRRADERGPVSALVRRGLRWSMRSEP